MTLRLLMILHVIFMSCQMVPPKTVVTTQVKEVKIYHDFQKKGYTTAGASTHFDDMEKKGIKKTSVSYKNRERLEVILNRTEWKKHFQTKFGTTNIFTEMTFSENDILHRVVITGVGNSYNIAGKSNGEYAFITDLTEMIDYQITNQSDIKWLKNFINEIQSLKFRE